MRPLIPDALPALHLFDAINPSGIFEARPTSCNPSLDTMGPQHAYGLASRLEQVAQPSLTLNQGTLYPALVRLEQKGWIKGTWRRTEKNREADAKAQAEFG